MNLKDKTVCFVDNGLFTSFARTVGKAFKKAYYYTPWQEQFPTSRRVRVGDGFPELEKVKYPLSIADQIDLWVFNDVFHADLQDYLVQHGARVWGTRYGEELELERWKFHKFLQRHNLPVANAELVVGMDKLREYLRDKKDVFVKNNFTRGDMETWKFKSWELNEPVLDQLAYDLGAFKSDYEFIVEEEIPDAVEIGFDGFCIDGQFPSPCMQAYEVKEMGMIGTIKPYNQLAEPVKYINQVMADTLAKYGYRGPWCTEIRYTKDKKPYFIDPCCRLGSPSNELLQELIGNWPEILWEGAEGNLVAPEPVAKFGAMAMIEAEQSDKHWQPIVFPEEIEQWVKLRNPYKIKGVQYAVPMGMPMKIGGVVGIGDTLQEAIKQCQEHSKQVKGDLVSVEEGAIEKATEVIEKGKKFGLHF